MTSLTITAEQAATERDGRILVILPGSMPEAVTFTHDGSADGVLVRFVPDPPAVFVAATTECRRCGGEGGGYVQRNAGPNDGYVWEVCPDCHEGAPLIDVRALCQACRGDGWKPVEDRIPGNQNVKQWECDGCTTNGTVPLGQFVAYGDVLPIVDGNKCDGPPATGKPVHLCLAFDDPWSPGVWMLLHVTHLHDIANHIDPGPYLAADETPDDLVGQYGLWLRRVQ